MSNRIRHYLKTEVEQLLPKLHECYRIIGVYQKSRSTVHRDAAVAQITDIAGDLQFFKSHIQPAKQAYFDVVSDESLPLSDRIIALDIAVGAMHIEFPVSRSYSHQESEELKAALAATRFHETDDEHATDLTENGVTGIPASDGMFTGKVHLIRRASEYKRIPKNTVIVAKMTRPEFVVAADNIGAIVTERGGTLCHAAIVSRELQIPCVVGVSGVMEYFRNGQIVCVDGSEGTVKTMR